MASVSLRQLSKSFDHAPRPALDAFSLEVRDGEFLVLLGPSGCGKTTALRCIAGLEEVSDGRILIGERDVTHATPAARDVAMVFQSYALYPHLSVRDNIAFALEVRGVPTLQITRRVLAAAERLGLRDLLDRRPAELSGGQRQRAALGRAIVREPQAFLFDEPLSNLDAQLRIEMRSELLQLHRQLAATMIYVTHDQVEAMTMGQRIAVLHEGRIEAHESLIVPLLREDFRFEPMQGGRKRDTALPPLARGQHPKPSGPRPAAQRRWYPRSPPGGYRWTGERDPAGGTGSCVRCEDR